MTALSDQHRALIAASAIAADVAVERGYFTATTKTVLRELGFGQAQAIAPALVVPVHGVDGGVVTYQARPDRPRVVNGKALKYETPKGSRMVLDVPPRARHRLGDPAVPLFVTEGARKADAAVSAGLCCVALLGVWNWRGTNEDGGKTALADWERVALNERIVYIAFDSDAMVKREVNAALERLAAFLSSRGADTRFVYLPALDGGAKCGLDDFLAAGNTVDDLLACAGDELRRVVDEPQNHKPETPLVPTGQLLVDVAAFVDRYVSLPSRKAAMAVALWVLHTWALDGAHATPYLVLQSPAKRSGKTRAQEVLELLVARPWRVAAASEAAMFRRIAEQRPTLLLDEVDAIFGSRGERTEPIRGLLNAGNRPGAAVARVVGEGANLQTVDFSVYCAKALAGIDTGRWPDTILDRAVRITMHRKAPGDRVQRFRHRAAVAEVQSLRAALERWAAEHVDALRDANPDLPNELNDRAAEAWEPLLAISDLAGADMGARARQAAVALSTGTDSDDDAHGLRLLRALRIVFGDEHALTGTAICDVINADDELPFGAWRDGKGLDGRTLARLLKPFEIRPRSVRPSGSTNTAKGYLREQFEEAWERYSNSAQTADTPSADELSGTSGTSPSQSQKAASFYPAHDPVVPDEKTPETPDEHGDVPDVPDENRAEGVAATNGTLFGHSGPAPWDPGGSAWEPYRPATNGTPHEDIEGAETER